MISLIFASFAVSILAAQVVSACDTPPSHMYLNHDATIEDAEWIALAKPVKRVETQDGLAYEMEAIEYIKGDGPEVFLVKNADQGAANGDSRDPAEANYYGHSVSSFWENGGRYSNWPDCEIHPGFYFAGSEYLIFGPLDYNLGFENVTRKNDLWLKYVRAKVAGDKARKPFPIKPESYFKNAAAILRVRAEWDGTRSSWVVDRLKGPDLAYLNMAHVSPSAAFDSQLDPNCDPLFMGRPRPKNLDRLYVFELLPEKDIKFGESLFCLGGNKEADGLLWAHGQFSNTGVRIFEIKGDIVRLQNDCPPYRDENRCKTPVSEVDIEFSEVEKMFQ